MGKKKTKKPFNYCLWICAVQWMGLCLLLLLKVSSSRAQSHAWVCGNLTGNKNYISYCDIYFTFLSSPMLFLVNFLSHLNYRWTIHLTNFCQTVKKHHKNFWWNNIYWNDQIIKRNTLTWLVCTWTAGYTMNPQCTIPT